MRKPDYKTKFLPFSVVAVTAVAAGLAVVACNNEAKAKPNFVTKDAPKAGVVAKIGGEEITDEQLIGEDKIEFFELKKREYELRMDRLNKLVLEKLVGAEAKAANMPLEEYIDKKVTKGAPKISDKDVNNFIKEKRIPESQINPQIKERIVQYLQAQKKQDMVQEYVAKLTKKNPVEVYFAKPKMDIKVELGNAPVWGKADAPVTIVEFSDFQCPFCSRGAETVSELKKKYGEKKIKIAFKHFPLPMHREAQPAAEASMCVYDQDPAKFWKFHDVTFKKQDKLDAASLESYAKEAGADVAKYQECIKSNKFKDFIAQDMKYGESIGVRSTPTFFINGEIVAGALPIKEFSDMIDEQLEAAKAKK